MGKAKLNPLRSVNLLQRRKAASCSKKSVETSGALQTDNEIEKKEHLRFQYHKSKGQHILNNDRILRGIVEKAELKPTDTVLEIGPGTGNLTMHLLNSVHKVIAVELDSRMVSALQHRIRHSHLAHKLELIQGDIMRTNLPVFDVCVANIPYQISSPLLFKLLSKPPTFRSATLMFQKEFARRLVAKPGESCFNRLAVNANLLAKCNLLMDVGRANFVPCPKVDSAVVRIEPKQWPLNVDLSEWNAFIRLCFTRKNKTMGAILKHKLTAYTLMKKAVLGKRQSSKAENLNWFSLFDESEMEGPDDDAKDALEDDEQENLKITKFREKLVSILEICGYQSQRPAKLSQEDFLTLLLLFNRKGVYFS